MRVCLYYKAVDKPWGGTNRFILNLAKFLLSRGIDISAGPGDCDVLLLNGAYKAPGKMLDPRQIKRLRQGYRGFWGLFGKRTARPAIVYRLDGLRGFYSGAASAMDSIQLECLSYVDYVVFQSRFAAGIFAQKGFIGGDFKIIHNGVDQDIFNCRGRKFWDKKEKLKIISSSWSSNLNKGHESIARFSQLPGVEVSFIGQWPKELDAKNVRLSGPLNADGLSQAYRQAHVFLFPALHEACPNTVLEAISCGLPVMYLESGGTPEVAGGYGALIRGRDEAGCLEEMRAGYDSFVANIIRDMDKFSIEHVGAKYLEVFDRAMSCPKSN